MRRILFIAAAIAAFMGAGTAQAQKYEGARPAALGGAYSAVASGNEAIFYNPAGMSLYPNRYNIDVGYAYNPFSGGNWFNASIMDVSTNSPMGFGISFFYNWDRTVPEPRTWYKGYRLDLAISYPAHKLVLWGVNIKWMQYKVNSRDDAIISATGDMGLLILAHKWVRVATVGRNLVPIARKEFPYEAVAGMAAGSESKFMFNTEFTTAIYNLDDITFRVNAGMEAFLGEYVSLRAGYYWDQKADNSHYVGMGVGFVSPKLGFDVAYKQNCVYTDDRFILAVIRIFAGG
jgi:hypothetical protein